jgi:6,7-dimethyl-8-ribityllumazine synthase
MGNAPTQVRRDATGMKIAVVTARWNGKITSILEKGALGELEAMGCRDVKAVHVAGAFEIPLAVKALFDVGYDGVVALGVVIRGETTHYDYVCSAVERGCSELALRFGKPVGFGILTTENEEQAMDRAGGRHGNKGAEAAQVTVEMVQLLREIKG